MQNTATTNGASSERLIKIYQVDKTAPSVYKPTFGVNVFPTALTFDDVLLVPQYSEINSRSECNISSKFSRNVPLMTPIVSSPMDTVTEADMAINMAKLGGIGVLHRFNTIEQQVKMLNRVKRSGAFINTNPLTVNENETFAQIKEKIALYNVRSFLVTNDPIELSEASSPRIKTQKKPLRLRGILTSRDINNFQFNDQTVKEFMTPLENVISVQLPDNYSKTHTNLNELIAKCKATALKHRVEKVPLVNAKMEILGLTCVKDILNYEKYKYTNKDQEGRLYVGAAVGANKDYLERAAALVDADVDVLVVDIANGHAQIAIQATETLKDQFGKRVDIVSGSIASGEGAEKLIRSGADGIRCGIGNGSICITRIVAGSGVPQLAALLDTAPVCQYYDVPLCSDGGNRYSGNMCKALAVGADCIMVGRLVAGCDESPGKAFLKDGKYVKMYRGMAGLQANMSKQERMGKEDINPSTFSAEGVEGYIPYMGPLEFVIGGFASGMRSGMSYSGAHTLKEFRQNAKFVRITSAGSRESHVHDINKI